MIHFIGKDNIVFHCIIFPVILKESGSYILPENVPANEFLNLEGKKISTSKNWAVWLHEYLEEFPNQQDVLRYVLTSNAPETKDNDFTWEEFQSRNNNELVAIYGNFINRVLVLTHKYYNGIVPKVKILSSKDDEILNLMSEIPEKIGHAIENYRFREASQILMQLARYGNKYLADSEPWKLIKTNPDRVLSIMNTAIQISAGLAVVSRPFLPNTAKKLNDMLNINILELRWDDISLKNELIPSGHQIKKSKLLFEKIDNVQIEQQLVKLNSNEKVNQEIKISPIKPVTSYKDFDSLDLQVAEIIEAQKIEKTKKLMEITVQLKNEVRTIVSGIALDFNKEDLIGKKVTLLTNLPPRKLKGVVSNGMRLLT